MRLFTAMLGTETNTFSPIPAGFKLYQDFYLVRGGRHTEPYGFFALPLVRFRAQAMQEAVPVGEGGMAAILGLSDDDVRAACAEAAAAGAGVVEAVNFNAPSQVVIAGNKAAVEKACEIAKGKGAKRALPLPVSAPFHSSLLKPASDRLRERMAGLAFSAPTIPLVNNVDVAIVNDPAQIKDALVQIGRAHV